jgi:hypothetical protein
MKYLHFKDKAATLAYVESELIATLEDDVRDLISQGANSNRATINELKAKVSDIGTAFNEVSVASNTMRMHYAGAIGLLCRVSSQLDRRDLIVVGQAVKDWCAMSGWTMQQTVSSVSIFPPKEPKE